MHIFRCFKCNRSYRILYFRILFIVALFLMADPLLFVFGSKSRICGFCDNKFIGQCVRRFVFFLDAIVLVLPVQLACKVYGYVIWSFAKRITGRSRFKIDFKSRRKFVVGVDILSCCAGPFNLVFALVRKAGVSQMTIIREFLSNFTKVKRTPIILLHLLTPIVITTLFLVYYAFGGYHTVPDVRLFFVILQICYPIFVSVVVPILIHLDRNINGIQNALGLVESRRSVYLGKLFFLMFLSAISIMLYELCFYVGVNLFMDIDITYFGSYFVIFCIFLFGNLFLYLLHIPIAFRFGSSISALLGIFGAILAGYFQNAIGDKIWPIIPWEWGVRFLEGHFGFSSTPVFPGIISLLIVTSIVLISSILWFNRWEGKFIQE